MIIKTEHIYRVYSPTGSYLGLLPVSTPFSYNQTIGTTFTQLQVASPITADTADQAVSPILDETGSAVLDETGSVITDEGVTSPVGDGNNNLIANNNLVKVYEVSPYNLNGVKVFDGYISKFKPIHNDNDDSVLITIINNGADAKDYMVQGSPYVSDQSQTARNSVSNIYAGFPDFGIHAQTFTVGAGVSRLDAIDIYLAASLLPSNYTVYVYDKPGGTLLGSSTQFVNTDGVVKFIFPGSISVTANTSYFFDVEGSSAHSIGAPCGYQNSDVYSGGSAYQYGYGPWGAQPYDLYFVTYYNGGGLTAFFSNQDVSAILTSIINTYGGYITVPPGGYSNTGTVTSYKFSSQTVLQALPIIQSLAPANWYWYVDPATNQLVFKQANTRADILLIKGRHINAFEPEATKENIKNVAYFTGGDDGTGTSTNIFVKVTNPTGNNRTGMVQLSDNRVSAASIGSKSAAEAVGRLIAQNYLNNNSAETYIATVTVQGKDIDLTTLKLGLMVKTRGFGTFEDSLLLQIVGINRQVDQAVLQLGTLPLRSSKQVQQISAQLTAQQTVDNPSSPS